VVLRAAFLQDSLWTVCWLRRRWTYLGHVLRQHPQHISRHALRAGLPVKQAVGHPWHTLVKWGIAEHSRLTGSALNFEAMAATAQDRDQWRSLLPALSQSQQQPSFIEESCWHSWADSVRSHVEWCRSFCLLRGAEGLHVVWLDDESGWMSRDMGDPSELSVENVCRFWSYWLMLGGTPPLSAMLHVDWRLLHEISLILEPCVHQFWEQFALVLSFCQVKRSWIRRTMNSCGPAVV
jgi:hypothetical protein